MRHVYLVTFLICAFLLIPTHAFAQITNGDFENGGTGWVVNQPPNWTVQFLAAGGNPNGYAQIHSPFGNSQGEGSISQNFVCGTPGTNAMCDISFDYQCQIWDASPDTGRLLIYVDGNVEMLIPCSNDNNNPPPFRNVTVTVPCGTHTLTLALEVDPGNNGWQACFDNVRADCVPPVGTEPTTWGRIKDLF